MVQLYICCALPPCSLLYRVEGQVQLQYCRATLSEMGKATVEMEGLCEEGYEKIGGG